MSEVIARVFVAGRPRTKGHMQGRGRNVHDRPLLIAWMRTMGVQIQRQLGIKMAKWGKVVHRVDGGKPYAGPVEVHAFFRFDRELSRAEAKIVHGEVIDSHATPWPTTIGIGDEDTLRRAVLDALVKNGVIKDDSLSVGGMNYKRWCEPGEQAGVLIVVREAPDPVTLRHVEHYGGGEL